ncbi:hypothetical protein J2Y58_003759 [Sphingomonas sp. BE138]|nr:hypothetical protein [Sphingomonas sp. BE138]
MKALEFEFRELRQADVCRAVTNPATGAPA